ncbi:diguanylate cyclase domain-containing protein [Acanthopleuribacter pedis]|uniref:Diguanylate cyclase n=1 Tax=Acanthopleuribacter pedis TaxID=442870 RepID=A0A8J7U6B6_9BACT|nr:diguanylate cyclase [Acanthopleuribacter pedis]MBO1323448.1 diguanylate cyclase [Acanthopleuribacter pedis]
MWPIKNPGLDDFKNDLNKIQENEIASCLLIDVDLMSAINDNYGHEYGNDVLERIHVSLADFCSVYTSCFFYHLSSDEFLVLISNPEINPIKFTKKIQKIIEELNMPFSHPDIQRPHRDIVTISVGCITGTIQTNGWKKILNSLEESLYQAKRSQPSGVNITKLTVVSQK